MPEHFDDLPVLRLLGAQVHAAAVSAERADGPAAERGRSWTPKLLAALVALLVPVAAGSAGATLYVLRGSVIPVSSSTPPEQLPAAGTSRLSGAVAVDPRRGQPRWTVRLATSRTGLTCSTAGQLVGGRFGVVGLDGRFRTLAPEVADACSTQQANATTLVGARTFDAPRRSAIRTVVSGVGGPTLRAVRVTAGGRQRQVPVRPGGIFVLALVGLPEDLGLRVGLRFADGHEERQDFGVGPLVFPDPDGRAAWRVSSGVLGTARGEPPDRTTCVSVRPAREVPSPPRSPPACGTLGGTIRRSTGVFFDVRRLTARSVGSGSAGSAGPFGAGAWRRTPPRLLVWGAAGQDVAAVRVLPRRGAAVTGTWFRPNGAFAFMLGPRARVGDAVLEVRFRGGRVLRTTRPTGLEPPPSFRRSRP